MTSTNDAYTQLIAYLDQHGIPYRLIDHAPEGRTEIVSPMRGNALSQAAKCIILMVKIGKKVTRYVLGVIPGDAKVDFNAVKTLLGGTYVSFASPDIAERLAGSVAGTILPFAFNAELELVVDPSLLDNEEIFFNAARLDRSMVLKTKDYVALTQPRLERIASQIPISTNKTMERDKVMTNDSRYAMNMNTRFAPLELVDVQKLVDAVTDQWYNQTLCQVNDCVVRLGVMQGEFHWHKHDEEDEFFYVVEGRFIIDLEDRTVELTPRQGFTVPKGVLHKTRAPERTVILMIEGAGVVPTGS